MKILYVHGFGSAYDPNHEKIQTLETIGTVVGVNVDYCKGYQNVFETVMTAVTDEKVDLIVGTSMGGYMAAHVGSACGVPFVSMNPATNPSDSLQRWVGRFSDYHGNDHFLSDSVVAEYPDIVTTGAGLVLLDSADEVINAYNTQTVLDGFFEIVMFQGGSHRFAHVEEALPFIKEHFNLMSASFGTGV